MSDWIKLCDRMPDEGCAVLITDGKVVVCASFAYRGWERRSPPFWIDGVGIFGQEWEWDFSDAAITHWMPLPALPKPDAKDA